jgi:serine/threonine-protein kinase PknG
MDSANRPPHPPPARPTAEGTSGPARPTADDRAPEEHTAAAGPPDDTAATDPPEDTAATDPPDDTAGVGPPEHTAAADPPEHTAAAGPADDSAAAEADTGRVAESGRSVSGRARSSSGRSTRRGRLGAGLVEVPRVPSRDPATAMLSHPEVPESKRVCGRCNEPVGRSTRDRPARAEGTCSHCGAPFSFVPKLAPGELVAGQYEVLGCLAHGGYGWIYLAKDHNVSDRWVVLKGLLDTGDPDAMAAALAERRFLAEVEHPNIVRIYNFVQHPDPAGDSTVGYIVMEYVGGKSIKELRYPPGEPSEPLPLEQAIAYAIEALPALGYLHELGMLYCDFKPDNIIQTDELVKLIDMGAVRRIDDLTSPVYGTVGYQAPEVPRKGPSVSSDLYTVARTLAVLTFDFRDYATTFADRLPDQADVELFTRFESYYRLLRRATHADPARRFGSAEEMADQLTGVLREVLATEDGQPRPGPSTEFSPERRVFGADGSPGDTGPPDPAVVAAALPVPQVNRADPAAGWLATAATADPAELVEALRSAPIVTVEVRLRLVRTLVKLGSVDEALAELDELSATEPADWRFTWYRGVALLAGGRAGEALGCFDAVYDARPGELAVKLALAAAAECAGEGPTAAHHYELVWRTDHTMVSAAFGLARVRRRLGDREGAFEVLRGVPENSRHHVTAQLAAIGARVFGRPATELTEQDLVTSCAWLDSVDLDIAARARMSVEVLTAALRWVRAGRPGGSGDGTVLGCALNERELRFGLERAYRSLARVAERPEDRIALVDRANTVRPKTLF